MREMSLTEWRGRPETLALLLYLRKRKAATVQMFLQGQPVDLVAQGRAAAFHDLDVLLTSPIDDVRRVFEEALKEQKI